MSAVTKVGPVRALAATLFLVLSSTTAAAVDLKPGEIIDKTNSEKVKDVISPGVMWCVNNGMELEIVPYEEIPIPNIYKEATEKYSAQVGLTEDNMLSNWVAGKPFPSVDNNDPHAATKIMYNFERTHYFTETLDLNLVDADTGSNYIDAKGSFLF